MEVITQSKRKYKVDNCKELIEKMYKDSGKKEDNIKDYMEEVSRRNKIYTGDKLEYKNEKEFIIECIKSGIIKSIKTENSNIIRGNF